jgi:hypothetical protein
MLEGMHLVTDILTHKEGSETRTSHGCNEENVLGEHFRWRGRFKVVEVSYKLCCEAWELWDMLMSSELMSLENRRKQ